MRPCQNAPRAKQDGTQVPTHGRHVVSAILGSLPIPLDKNFVAHVRRVNTLTGTGLCGVTSVLMSITLQHGGQLPACRVPLEHLPVQLALRFIR